MSELQTRFEAAAQAVKDLPPLDNETMLKLYALYKQATAGDVCGERPGGFDIVGQAKHDAWAGVKGVSQADAMQAYVELVDSLK